HSVLSAVLTYIIYLIKTIQLQTHHQPLTTYFLYLRVCQLLSKHVRFSGNIRKEVFLQDDFQRGKCCRTRDRVPTKGRDMTKYGVVIDDIHYRFGRDKSTYGHDAANNFRQHQYVGDNTEVL